ncbi:MAG: Sec-independent protein translocase protein TatB [Gammaproteobacteria bacterium]
MSDIGFSELLLVVAIALIVIGPKRLPEAARFLGYWTGKLRRTLHTARQDMERELGIDDIKREVHNQLRLEELDAERKQVEETFRRTQNQPPQPLVAPPLPDPDTLDFIDDEPSEPKTEAETPPSSETAASAGAKSPRP